MLHFLNSIINYKTIVSSFISAIGYGIGYSVPNAYGFNSIICIIISLIVGTPFDIIAEKLLSYKPFIGSKKRKIIFTVIVYITYLVAWYVLNKLFVYDLDEDFLSNLLLIIIFQIIALIMYYLKKYVKTKYKERKNDK